MFKSRARKFADMFNTSLADALEGNEIAKTEVEGLTDVEAKSAANETAISALHTVATTGSYSDLVGTPALHTVATSGDFNDLLNQPAPFDPTTLATVATTGSFNDLSDQPAPFDPTTLATVATTGSYSDLSGTPQSFPTGTKMLFQQTSAPTGWTKDTTHNNKALRVVSGTAGSGGTSSFTTAFANRSTNSVATGGTVSNHTLTTSQMPSHSHNVTYYRSNGAYNQTLPGRNTDSDQSTTRATGSAGGGGSHSHGFTGSSHSHTLDMAVQYVDLIIATKD